MQKLNQKFEVMGSVSLFESWEDYTKIKVYGYTFMKSVNTVYIEFSKKNNYIPNENSIERMAELFKAGYKVVIVHYVKVRYDKERV